MRGETHKIEKLRDPVRTLGDNRPFYSCYYENVPSECRIGFIIRPDLRYPKTGAILPYLIEEADNEFTGWEINARTFGDFKQRVKHAYAVEAANLERYISKLPNFDVALSSITKNIVGKGKTTVTNDATTTNDTTNTQTFDNYDMVTGSNESRVKTDNTLHNTNKTDNVTDTGHIAINAKDPPQFIPSGRTTNNNSATIDGHTKGSNATSTWNDSTTYHDGDITNVTDNDIHNSGTNTTETDERITTTESITPGVAIAELARIPGIMSAEKYFINILKPCFTLYRWISW